jgi:hypothetical protein
MLSRDESEERECRPKELPDTTIANSLAASKPIDNKAESLNFAITLLEAKHAANSNLFTTHRTKHANQKKKVGTLNLEEQDIRTEILARLVAD